MAPSEINRIKQSVEEKFAELKSALMMREKLLLRQLDVINRTYKQQQLGTAVTTSNVIDIQFVCDNEKELLTTIRNFGRYHLTNINLALQDLYLKNEDYIEPIDDHETMFKDLNAEEVDGKAKEYNDDESVLIDFSSHKSIMAHNAKRMNNSIVNITLNEAKELIRKAKTRRETVVPPLNLEELDDEVESSIAEAVSSLSRSNESCVDGMPDVNHKYSQTQMAKNRHMKSEITINNCNGVINLRNIASLTINCTTEDNIKAQIPLRHHVHDLHLNPDLSKAHESNVSIGSSSSNLIQTKTGSKPKSLLESIMVTTSGSTECNSSMQTTVTTSTSDNTTPASMSNYLNKQKSKKTYKNEKTPHIDKHDGDFQDSSSAEVNCEFYNRLLNEIKKTMQQNPKGRTKCLNATAATAAKTEKEQPSDGVTADNVHLHVPLEDYLNSEMPQRKRFILKNFENLRIILEAQNGGDEDVFHPVQIEQWLAEIIADTDLEPIRNTDILEHSKIYTNDQEN
uniref:Uncharacterized protein n=1 Tax=Glossina morsitans morsitans TaxID=37546 RepID=A0A1B0FQ49_GLOMM